MLTQKCRSAPTRRSKMTSLGSEIIINMSSVLNVSNGCNKSEEFNLNDIEVLVGSEEQSWFKRAHFGTFLGLKHIDTLVGGFDKCEMPTRNDIKTTPHPHGTGGWPAPKDHQNKRINSS